jgi:tetratricopeptide (TPR) repeat protein
LVLLVSSCSSGPTTDEASSGGETAATGFSDPLEPSLPPPKFSVERIGDDPFLEPRQRIEALVEVQRTPGRTGRGEPPRTLEARIAEEFARLSTDDQAAWHQARDAISRAIRTDGPTAGFAQLDAVLDLEERLFGTASARVAGTLLQRARLRIEHQDFAHARSDLERHCEILHGIYGTEYWLADEARCKLQVLDRLERLPEDVQKLLGFEQVMLAQYRQHAERQDFRQAAEHGQRYYQLCQVVYGDEHPQTGVAASNLAHAHAANEEFQAATALYQEALTLLLRHFRVVNPLMAVVLQNIGTMFQYEGRPALAESYLRLAIEVNGACYGTSDSVYAITLNNLAYLYETVGDAARAIAVLGHARTIRAQLLAEAQRRLESDPSLQAAVRGHQLQLAFIYLNLGSAYTPSDPVRAEAYLREGVAMRRRLLGDSPSTARAINTQANLYHTLGDRARAKELLTEAVAMYRKSPQPGILDVSTAINDLATVHFDLGQYDVAIELLAAALAMQTGSLGGEHPTTLRTKANLAKIALAAGRLDLAEKLQQEVLQARAATSWR